MDASQKNIINKGRNLMKLIPNNSKKPEKRVNENLFDANIVTVKYEDIMASKNPLLLNSAA